VTLRALAAAQRRPSGRFLLRRIAGTIPKRPVKVFGLHFPNELGVAAGYDKNAQAALGLALLGFGHVEVGTVTPWAQEGNRRPRIFRLPQDRALINRMGFPNQGMARVAAHLRQMPRRQVSSNGGFVLGASLGKQKETPLDEAGADYVAVLRAVYPHVDYLAVNVSSPNTPGLRQLQGRRYLESLLGQIQEENRRLSPVGIGRPLLLKIAPDLSWAEIDQILEAAEAQEINGIIATNTTVERPALSNGWSHEAGGLSGEPLAGRSMEIIAYVYRQVGDKMPVIGVGGVTSADDVQARLDAGAALVQLYTGLIYEGPQLVGRLLRALEARRL